MKRVKVLDHSGGKRTERSCRGSRTRRNIGASGTSWARRTRKKPKHPKYHLSSEWSIDIPRYTIVTVHTDGSRLDHVADGKALDGLVLRNAFRAVRAADRLDVAAALLVTTAENERDVSFESVISPAARNGDFLRWA